MEPSELFLWVWAVSATVLAVWFGHRAKGRGMALIILTLGMQHVAEGKAELKMVDGQIQIKKKEEVNATTN